MDTVPPQPALLEHAFSPPLANLSAGDELHASAGEKWALQKQTA